MVRSLHPHPYRGLESDDWWHPVRLSDGQAVLSEEQLDRFNEIGFIVVANLWPDELVERAAREARARHPVDEVLARSLEDPGLGGFSRMPWTHNGAGAPDDALNIMTIHPRALSVVAQLMRANPMMLRLSQSHVIAKCSQKRGSDAQDHGELSGDQDIHVDYGNNTLLVPPREADCEAVACLCYYSDVDECGGSTHFAEPLPGELTRYTPATFNPPNFVADAPANDGPRAQENIERMYAAEKPVYYKPGTAILYRLNAWHRGTPTDEGKVRYTHHHVWRHKNAEWVNWQSLAPAMAAMPGHFLTSLSVEQRTVLGFAEPGNAYWTNETIDAVGRRYPGMDMTPYREGLAR